MMAINLIKYKQQELYEYIKACLPTGTTRGYDGKSLATYAGCNIFT